MNDDKNTSREKFPWSLCTCPLSCRTMLPVGQSGFSIALFTKLDILPFDFKDVFFESIMVKLCVGRVFLVLFVSGCQQQLVPPDDSSFWRSQSPETWSSTWPGLQKREKYYDDLGPPNTTGMGWVFLFSKKHVLLGHPNDDIWFLSWGRLESHR